MFFTPPKVKSLSKYSEFGSHMGEKEFILMIGLAMLAHLVFIWIYSQTPHEHAMVIPVRVLNIKLDPGIPELTIPKLSDMPNYTPPQPAAESASEPFPARPEPAHEHTTQAAANKVYNSSKQKSLVSILSQDTERRKTAHGSEKLFNDGVPAKPRKYVRENEIARAGKSQAGGNGTDMEGDVGGTEIVTKYTQLLSLWLEQHKVYPQAAIQQHAEGSAVVRVHIDRSGRVLWRTIQVSSGNPLIDQAALDMVDHSNPMPKVPDNYPAGREFEYTFPVSFTLK